MSVSANKPGDEILPTANLQYADYVRWQASLLESPQGQLLWEYWEKELASNLPLLNLPTDRQRPPVPTYQGDVCVLDLPPDRVRRLEALAVRENATLFSVLLTAYYVLLHRLSAQDEIVVGVPLNSSWQGSNDGGGTIGMVANPMVCRVQLDGNPSFQTALRRVERTLEGAEKHRDYPFPLLVERLASQRDNSMPPLFQVAFGWEELAWYDRDAGIEDEPFAMEPYPLGEQRGGAFDIYLTVMKVGDALQLCWKYSTDLFEAETITRIANRYQCLLEGLLDRSDCPIAELPFLPAVERQQLLVHWNGPQVDFARESCLHELFERQARETPNAIAVEFKHQQLTYRQLDAHANQLAHYLQGLGIGPECLVGLCVERSFDTIVGLLGILKAGGAYLPLDPGYPPERIAYMLEDARVSVMLVQQHLVDRLPANDTQVICLDTDWQQIAQQSPEAPETAVTPENLAYIIYTSGSTGKPKGVAVEHRSLVNFSQMAIREYGIIASDRVLQFATISFDTAAEEIYPCLICGGTLVLRTDAMLASIPVFLQHCRELNISILDLPTAYWNLLVAEIAANPNVVLPDSIRRAIVGGEKMSPQQVLLWQQHVGAAARLINGYGPTEGTVVATAYKAPLIASLDEAQASDGGVSEVPIGKPLGNIETYILDKHRHLAPIGVPGELYIGGVCLARGYLNRPDLTAERFVEHPFSDDSGARLYRTGDLTRYLPDGNIQYLGRIDHQVKIRGFRIELGEIEAAIATYPGMEDALVIAHEDSPNEKRLIAYIVSNIIPDQLPLEVGCTLECGGKRFRLRTESFTLHTLTILGGSTLLETGSNVRLQLQLPGEECDRWLEGTVQRSGPTRMLVRLQPNKMEEAAISAAIRYLLMDRGLLRILQKAVVQNLKDHLKHKLPEYMVPANFVLMDTFPLTPNGKVDRKRLPIPQPKRQDETAEIVEPRNPTEEKLVALWQDVLGIPRISVSDNFFELGGHSLLAIKLINGIGNAFSVEMPVRTVLERPTLEELAQTIARARRESSGDRSNIAVVEAIDLKAEAILDPEIQVPEDIAPVAAEVNTILMTGPTGFVGPYILEQILEQTSATVYCLIRERRGRSPQEHIEEHLRSYNLWKDGYHNRVRPLVGDLSQPLLGLTEEAFDHLARKIDVIYHNGAWVNFVYPYAALKPSNVGGTEEVLRLACRAKLKPVHYISTLSVFPDVYSQLHTVMETEDPGFEDRIDGGYDSSKWVAERLVKIAGNRGIPISVHRLGTIVGDSRTGIMKKPNDFFCSLLKGCIQLKKAPTLSLTINLTPIDYISRATICLSQQEKFWQQTFHIISPTPISWASVVGLLQVYGYSIESVPYDEWHEDLKRSIAAGEENALSAFLPILGTEEDFPLEKSQFDNRESQRALAPSGISCPPIDSRLIGMYLDYFQKIGYLEGP